MARTFVYNAGTSKESIEDIHLQVGVFFDGTANNRTNTEIRKKIQKIDEYADQTKKENVATLGDKIDYYTSVLRSNYKNDFSNIARQSFSTEPDIYTIYIEGIGTEDRKGDFVRGQALGMGKTGVIAKVEKGCEELAKRIKDVRDGSDDNNGKKINVTVDVFGFSRGAAAARNFLYEINGNGKKNTSSKLGYLGEYLLSEEILNKKELQELGLTVRFLGLYDTVSSYGTDHDDVEQLHLNNIGSIKKAVHFTAMDEHRKNFALTRLPQAEEFDLPGVHSDIGGGYNDNPEKDEEEVTIDEYSSKEAIDLLVDNLKEQSWYKEKQLTIKPVYIGSGYVYDDHNLVYSLTGKRVLSKAYSFIPLEFMDRKFKEIIDDEEKQNIFIKSKEVGKKYSIDGHPVLIESKKRLEGYVFGGREKWVYRTKKELEEKKLKENTEEYKQYIDNNESDNGNNEVVLVYDLPPIEITAIRNLLGRLRNEYLHWSAHYDDKKLGIPPMNPTSDRKRKEY
ncbi:DUF2235 domain-containing protein [Bergeyella sp. RCAD1439]|uniref:DUF2235 domain-containing protein n=1 Tax=Bergeyella anatis TaxID=3113737 RepID=UPI002E18A403|nr:DUF2235 domain-containing protein [Bergeyella sp. RCAD1439]